MNEVTPLHIAVKNQYVDIVKLLLSCDKTNVNLKAFFLQKILSQKIFDWMKIQSQKILEIKNSIFWKLISFFIL